MTITLTPAVYAALTVTTPPVDEPPYSLGDDQTLTSVAPGRMAAHGRFTFPVTGGSLRAPGFTGTVASTGGLAFTYRSNGPMEDSGGYEVTGFHVVFSRRAGKAREPELVASSVSDPLISKVIATLDMRGARQTQRRARMTISRITLKLTYDHGSNPIGGLDGALRNGSQIGTASLRLTTRP